MCMSITIKDKRKPRILMVIGQFYPIVGGAERQAQKLAKTLIRKGLSVTVATGRHHGLKKRGIVDGIPIFRTCIGKKYVYKFMFSLFCFLLRNRSKYDIIHIHQGLYPAFVGVLASRLLNKKSIIKIGNSGERFDLKVLAEMLPFGGAVAKYILHVDKVVAISDQIEQDLLNFGFNDEKILRIPNGVEIVNKPNSEQASNIRKKLHIPENTIIATFVGSIVPKKNVGRLIEAWEIIVARSDKPVKLIILGDGAQKDEITNLVELKKLREYVRLCGEVDNVEEYLAISDIFVLPSVVEGLSNALLEAMSHGLACAVSEIPGNIDLIKHERNGLLFPYDDINEMAKQILKLIDDEELREKLSSQALETIKQSYTLEKVADSYIDVYNALLV